VGHVDTRKTHEAETGAWFLSEVSTFQRLECKCRLAQMGLHVWFPLVPCFAVDEIRHLRVLTFSILCLGLANWASLPTMNEPSPERPTLLFDLVFPSRSEHFFLNLWIADPHVRNSLGSIEGVPRTSFCRRNG